MSKAAFVRNRESAYQMLSRFFKLSLSNDLSAGEAPLLWRERVMFAIYLTAIVMGSVSFVSSTNLAIRNGYWFLVVSYVVAYVCGIMITFVRCIPYHVRAWCGLVMFYVLGLLASVTGGPAGSGRLWFFSFSIIATLLLGQNVGLLTLGVNAGTFLLLGWLMSKGVLTWPVIDLSLRVWTVGSLTFILLNTIVTVAIAVLLRGLGEGLKKEQALAGELATSNEQLRAEMEERQQAEEALRKSEASYRLLAQNVTDVIWTTDLDFRFTYVSPSVLRLRGYTVEEAMTKPMEDVLTPASLEDARKALVEELARENGAQEDWSRSRTLELEHYCKDGSTIWAEVKVNFLRGRNGRPVGILGVTRDITEQKQLRQQLLQAQKMESVGTLAGGIAHDFNNLLAGILGYASLMKTRISKDHQFFSYVDTIERSATRASELTSQLLAFARGGKYETKVVDLNSIINETLEIIGRTFEKSIEIETHLLDPLPTIEADAGQMQQVLMNLCVNARDAMPGGGRLIIETDVGLLTEDYLRTHTGAKSGQYVTLSVTDTGTGMSKETVQRVFEPFFTTKPKGQGTGLGLAMVYGVVKNHGGHVSVYSELGQGSTFKVYLPVHGEPAPEEEWVVCQAPENGCELILVVDDEESVRSLAKDMLESYGYRVVLAEDGVRGVEVLEKDGNIDLVILDMVMPKIGGHETFLKMKELNPKVKVLLSTGYSQNGKAKEILDSGVMGFLQKPYDVNILLSKVRSVLDSKMEA